MDFETLHAQAATHGLTILGGFHPVPEDNCPQDTATLALLGPDPQTFWPTLQSAPEADQPDAVDRWSRRVIGTWACDLGAKALFPFGAPVQPFISWALRSGRCHSSPVQLLVHDTQGLMVSFRGALALKTKIVLPENPPKPCNTCTDKPCLTACPVDALGARYDTGRCHGHLDVPGNRCMAGGCAARRACIASKSRPDAQSAHHMRYFHR